MIDIIYDKLQYGFFWPGDKDLLTWGIVLLGFFLLGAWGVYRNL